MSDLSLTAPPPERPIRRRTRRDPNPRFKPDATAQLDAVQGCPSLSVPEDHLARAVLRVVERFDLSKVEAKYSSLGRRGFAPRRVLGVWIYASLIGLHHATKVARALRTDAALRLLSGGYAISRSKLNEFRQAQGELFAELIAQTVAMAESSGLLPKDDLAADSMRLRAHASTKAVRTLARSKKRLDELSTVDEAKLAETERESHREKIVKHTRAVEECERRGRTSVVTTNPSAALMKFPDGAGLPGHRIQAMAAGVKARFIVAVLVTADAVDYGTLESIVDETEKMLARAGSPKERLQIAADAGYSSQTDLAYAARVRERIDILVDGAQTPEGRSRFFGRERFIIHDDETATCPAGRTMKGPMRHSDGRTIWSGVGCGDCPLRADCTDGKRRSLTANLELERHRAAMQARMAEPDAKARYNRRIATVEPVFSNIEATMAYRRASSRREATVVAEVLLKVLTHNVSRLLGARRLSRVLCMVTHDGALIPIGNQFPATL